MYERVQIPGNSIASILPSALPQSPFEGGQRKERVRVRINLKAIAIVSFGVLVWSAPAGAEAAKRRGKTPVAEESSDKSEKVLWREPVDIESRNLLYGQGGREHQPTGTVFEFGKEDLNGTNPKFTVSDTDGTRWKIKLGDEARPETVATRLVWAAGYYTDEDYFLPEIHVKGMPPKVHRGQHLIGPQGTMKDVRFKREIPGEKKMGPWKWSDGPFFETREWNGLRVMMALINDWDLKDENNTVYKVAGEEAYVVSDLGASFGPEHLDMGRKHDKGDLKAYSRTSFIRKAHPESIDFTVPGAPSLPMAFNPIAYFQRRHLMWIGRNIPRQDARWMGTVLSRLSAKQIRDAFRAGGYNPEEVESFAVIVERRIAALTDL
jgi:hypothetical protein